MESINLQNKDERRRRYKEEEKGVPTSPNKPPNFSKRAFRASKRTKMSFLREN